MTLTRHAQVAAQQRCVPPLNVDWLVVDPVTDEGAMFSKPPAPTR
jgi:hypothetical protein